LRIKKISLLKETITPEGKKEKRKIEKEKEKAHT
jgi:hypothetical protein